MMKKDAATKLHGFPPSSGEVGEAPRYGAEVARCLVFVPMKPKAPVAEAKQPSVAAKHAVKQAVKPVPKKVMTVPSRPVPRVKAKTAAANGKLVVKKSKKEAR